MANMIAVAMPKWGLEMTEGTVVKIHVAEGDTVAKGQAIMDIETEKIANEFEAEAGGVIAGRSTGIKRVPVNGFSPIIRLSGSVYTARSAIPKVITLLFIRFSRSLSN